MGENEGSARDAPWAQGLAGAVLVAALLPRGPASAPAVQAPAPALESAAPRELRGVPGLGERRALALVDARWRRGRADPPLFLGDVVGVGPVSEEQVARWLAALGASSAPR